jgi:alpha-L-rhamnosidase
LYGPIKSDWKIVRDAFLWNVSVPPNTTATVYVPATDGSSVMEGSKPAAQADGVRFVRSEPDAVVYEIGSGNYAFRSGWKSKGAASK